MEKTLEIATLAGIAEERAPLDFDLLVRDHQRRIYRVLLGLVRDPEVADNLTQDCFVRAYEKRASYRGEASIGTWLVSIAINLARDHARSRRAGFWRRLFAVRDQEVSVALETTADARSTPEQSVIARDQLARVWEIVERLPQRQREVFLLRFAEELPLEEIAGVMGTEVGTVKAHLFRAVATVRKRMRNSHGSTTSTQRG